MNEFEDFANFLSNTSPAEVDIRITAMRKKVDFIADKLETLSNEDYDTVANAIREVVAFTISKCLPTPINLIFAEDLMNMSLAVAMVGYYVGKTGDKLDGV